MSAQLHLARLLSLGAWDAESLCATASGEIENLRKSAELERKARIGLREELSIERDVNKRTAARLEAATALAVGLRAEIADLSATLAAGEGK